jgi:hypothetical protein
MRRGGGVGFIVVIIAMAIVMILAMRSWLSVAPTAKQIMDINGAARAAGQAGSAGKSAAKGKEPAGGKTRPGYDVPAHGQDAAAAEERRGVLPDLSDMKDATDQHAADVRKAAEETNH